MKFELQFYVPQATARRGRFSIVPFNSTPKSTFRGNRSPSMHPNVQFFRTAKSWIVNRSGLWDGTTMDGVALALLDRDAVAPKPPRIGARQPRVSIVLPGLGAGGTEHVVNVLANRWPARGPDSQCVRAFVLLRRLGALLKAIAARLPIVTFEREVMHAALSSHSAEELSPC